ncbi:HEAT repeat domain-containing protein [Candidatus Poribacteria bacterium]|nr:HEAT repeat domain-containing protein [Candidatus Poribacteria bacterium]MYG08951.1 HEAT repeat domain-containing protein [Candidatus Poribacteria bacterium]MYK21619.1 HEAT repeat domain-containing protein [Candidatus Poribacteria bacterium]
MRLQIVHAVERCASYIIFMTHERDTHHERVSLIEFSGGKDKRNMKKILTILLLIGVVSFGCQQEQVITQLEVGRGKLHAGLTLEAVGHLERAEQEEANKVEPRALLVIAYSNALSSGAARVHKVDARYQTERDRRVGELGEYEMKKILQILGERHRVQKDAMQVLVDRGAPAVPFVLEDLVKNRYRKVHGDFIQILKDIGSPAIKDILEVTGDSNTPLAVKIQLVRIVGDIGDTSASAGLETLRNATTDEGLKMEINTALYLLGDEGSEQKIIEGLMDSNVVVRRAAAKSMIFLKEHPTTKMIDALEDSDDAVRTDIAIALRKYPDAGAVDNLIAILTNGSGPETKQAAIDTLNHYAENSLVNGLAARLIELLVDPKVINHEDRLRIVQLLKKPALIKQVKEADQYDNLPHKIYLFYEEKETNDMVRDELNQLLLVLEE